MGFEQLAHDNWGAISAGAPFPDYLYTCGTTDGAADMAAFQAAAANYIRANWSVSEILPRSARRD